MRWIIDNWSLLVVILAAVAVVIHYYKKFSGLPSDEQIKKIKQWLLAVVIEAEKEFKGNTGRVKLSYVYSRFIEAFPSLAPVIPFELFSSLVDEVLEEMRHLLETNANLAKYVDLEGEK